MNVVDRALVWFRRDLRVTDNPALARATQVAREVVPVVVLDARQLEAAGAPRRAQFLAHLRALDDELRALGAPLLVVWGDPASEIPRIAAAEGAGVVVANADVSPGSRSRDTRVHQALSAERRRLISEWGTLVHHPGAVRTAKGTLSQVFTPFHKVWAATPWLPWPTGGAGRLVAASSTPSHPLPTPAQTGPPWQPGGETAAHERLARVVDEIAERYPDRRDLPGERGTTELSADLRFGVLSPRAVATALSPLPGGAAIVRQLAWRDWYAHLLHEHPELTVRAMKPALDGIEWSDDPTGFDAWCAGRTGYPIVDAGMRQLAATGWMHNRVRMITASFLVKDLLIDWRLGERWFRTHLVDGDPAQNVGNWQWVAGTGPDAAPYFRIFNPVAQGRRFDPDGGYVRRWVPELAGLSDRWIHAPWEAPPLEVAAAGVTLGDTYPLPLVDHGEARERTLAAYRAAGDPLAAAAEPG